jgi:Spy/CpxP family protein refolding chaperone
MKTNKLLAFAVIALLIINGVLVYLVWNGKRQHNRGGQNRNMSDWLAKELNEDEKQKTEHSKLRDAHFASIKPLFDSVSAYKKGLFSLLKETSASDSLVQLYTNKISQTEAEISKNIFQHFKNVRAILNPDQQKKYEEIVQKMMSRRGGPSGRPDDKH